jgi:hypothetical protein
MRDHPGHLQTPLNRQPLLCAHKSQFPGSEVLRNPEPNFFILGSKSYGRCYFISQCDSSILVFDNALVFIRHSAFLMSIGLQQVAAITDMMCEA